jgi:ribosomal protein L7/L12
MATLRERYIEEYLRTGSKICSIKVLKEETGLGLLHSKNIVEAFLYDHILESMDSMNELFLAKRLYEELKDKGCEEINHKNLELVNPYIRGNFFPIEGN